MRSIRGAFWKGPLTVGGFGRAPVNRFPPSTRVSLQTSFFMAWAGVTHGPPDSLHPGEPAIAISRPSWSASVAAYENASFHSGVM
jgi:hypothetical protein